MHEEYDEYSAQHYALWQAAAFRLPLVQQEASCWWDTPPILQGLHPQDFLSHGSDPEYFQIIQQGKTLAVVRVLQGCADASGVKSDPMQSHQGAPTMHDPVDDHQWG